MPEQRLSTLVCSIIKDAGLYACKPMQALGSIHLHMSMHVEIVVREDGKEFPGDSVSHWQYSYPRDAKMRNYTSSFNMNIEMRVSGRSWEESPDLVS